MKLPLSCKEMTCFIYAEKDVVYPALLVALYQAAERTENPVRTLIKVARGWDILESQAFARFNILAWNCPSPRTETDIRRCAVRAARYAVNNAMRKNHIRWGDESADDEIISEIVANGYSLRQLADFTG